MPEQHTSSSCSRHCARHKSTKYTKGTKGIRSLFSKRVRASNQKSESLPKGSETRIRKPFVLCAFLWLDLLHFVAHFDDAGLDHFGIDTPQAELLT